jgi:hypothetical protein
LSQKNETGPIERNKNFFSVKQKNCSSLKCNLCILHEVLLYEVHPHSIRKKCFWFALSSVWNPRVTKFCRDVQPTISLAIRSTQTYVILDTGTSALDLKKLGHFKTLMNYLKISQVVDIVIQDLGSAYLVI